jgi:hypothetical protein
MQSFAGLFFLIKKLKGEIGIVSKTKLLKNFLGYF